MNSSIRRRVAVALFLWSAASATLFGVATFLAADEMELIVLEQNLGATAARIRQALKDGVTPTYPSETWFRGGLESELDLPRQFREKPAGSFNDVSFDGGEFHVWIDKVPGDRLFLIYDLDVIEHYESRLVAFLVTAVLLLSGLGLILGMLGTGWVMRPLVRLSGTVRRMKAGARSLDVPATDDADLAPMIDAIDDLLERNTALVKRESHFTRIVSHELRNPLATLEAALALMESRDSGDALAAPMGRARRASRRVADVVSALLQFARSEQMSEKVPAECRVADVVGEALLGLSDAGLDTSRVVTRVESRSHANMEPGLFGVIVTNLLGNALRHSDGRVELDADDRGVSVSNPVEEGEMAEAFAPDRLGIGIVELLCGYRGWAFTYGIDDGRFVARVIYA